MVAADRRKQAIAALDRAHAADGKPTTAELEAKIEKVDEEIDLFKSQIDAPPGFFSKLNFISAAARARAAAEHAAAPENLRRARRRREKMAEQLAAFYAAIEREIEEKEAAKAAKTAQASKVLADEAESFPMQV